MACLFNPDHVTCGDLMSKRSPMSQRLSFLLLLILIPPLWKALQTSVLPLVPAGDDSAYHVHHVIKAALNPLLPFNPLDDNQYPNIIHMAFAPAYLLTKNPILVAKILGIWAVASITIGFLLHALLIRKTSKSQHLEAVTIITMALLSREVLLTLNDGTIMYLFDFMILLPLATLALTSKRYLTAGILLGLSALNWAGFLFILVFLLPPLLDDLYKDKSLKPLIKVITGTIIGGNAPLVNLILNAYRSLLNPSNQPSLEKPMYPDLTLRLLILITSLALTSLLYTVKTPPQLNKMKKLLASWIAITLACTLFLILSNNPIAFNFHERFARSAIFLLYIPICHFASVLQMRIGKNKPPRQKPQQNHSIITILVLLIVLSAQISLYNMLYHYPSGTIQRLDQQKLEAYNYIKNVILKDENNSVILVIHQISSWAKPLLSVPERNITVLTLHPPDTPLVINLNSTPNNILLHALETLNATTLKELGVKYILVELPYQNQWYYPSYKKLAYELWNKDLSPIANLIYKRTYDNNGLKLWKITC